HNGTFKHDPNPLNEENLAELKATVIKEKCDFGVCFDGDADLFEIAHALGAMSLFFGARQ
ncbi:MAG: hypothetical protein ACXWC8_22595, partial [Limisphaerales bacterium]